LPATCLAAFFLSEALGAEGLEAQFSIASPESFFSILFFSGANFFSAFLRLDISTKRTLIFQLRGSVTGLHQLTQVTALPFEESP